MDGLAGVEGAAVRDYHASVGTVCRRSRAGSFLGISVQGDFRRHPRPAVPVGKACLHGVGVVPLAYAREEFLRNRPEALARSKRAGCGLDTRIPERQDRFSAGLSAPVVAYICLRARGMYVYGYREAELVVVQVPADPALACRNGVASVFQAPEGDFQGVGNEEAPSGVRQPCPEHAFPVVPDFHLRGSEVDELHEEGVVLDIQPDMPACKDLRQGFGICRVRRDQPFDPVPRPGCGLDPALETCAFRQQGEVAVFVGSAAVLQGAEPVFQQL